MMRYLHFLGILVSLIATAEQSHAIQITLDFTLDEKNENWFDPITIEGQARRAAVESAAGFLSGIITNNDWNPVPSFTGTLGFTDIQASSIVDLLGNTVNGSSESDGQGYRYSIPPANRSTVTANEYIIYVGAFQFDSATTAHAKASWDGSYRRNAAGFALTEFNTWGGQIYFDTGDNWYAGYNPGIDPSDSYGVQDPNKMPTTDITTDNWDWHTSLLKWNGFDLKTVDPAGNGRPDLYGTSLHEMIHALGATDSNLSTYVGVSGGNLIGENVMAEYGGPVPKASTGHFETSLHSEVWDSPGIISEVSLDPNSTSGARKYLTKLDAALLRDLGYLVLDQFNPADFNLDGFVEVGDLARWQFSYGIDNGADADKDGDSDGADFLAWQREMQTLAALSTSSLAIPEPSSIVLLAIGFLLTYRHITCRAVV